MYCKISLFQRFFFLVSGIEDNQMDCVLNMVSVVALYAGRPEMLDKVEEVITMTQNSDVNVAVVFTAARWIYVRYFASIIFKSSFLVDIYT
jgi:hypothetical protein